MKHFCAKVQGFNGISLKSFKNSFFFRGDIDTFESSSSVALTPQSLLTRRSQPLRGVIDTAEFALRVRAVII